MDLVELATGDHIIDMPEHGHWTSRTKHLGVTVNNVDSYDASTVVYLVNSCVNLQVGLVVLANDRR
jgi:hypothetical protein